MLNTVKHWDTPANKTEVLRAQSPEEQTYR